jgi:hypothetical protein
MKLRLFFLFAGFSFFLCSNVSSQNLYWVCDDGHVSFDSEAPLEVIKAQSKAVKGIISPASKSFAFSMSINSFEGFNSDIQKIHFLENYMEWKKYPEATFEGKFIEDIPFDTPGTYSVRAKGNLIIHGISKERIIRGTLIVKKNAGHLETEFSIPVSDHGILIPKIVQQKISDNIHVKVDMDFTLGNQL